VWEQELRYPAAAQTPKKPFVALVFTGVSNAEIAGPDPTFAPAQAFRRELRDLGWVDGETILIERRTFAGDPTAERSQLKFAGGRARQL